MINVNFPFITDGRKTGGPGEKRGGEWRMGKGATSFPRREKCHGIWALLAPLHLQPPCEPLQGDFSE